MIDQWDPPRRFVDTQLKGPYLHWHHTHDFEPDSGGTLMRDTVRYAMRAGRLGEIAHGPLVAPDLGEDLRLPDRANRGAFQGRRPQRCLAAAGRSGRLARPTIIGFIHGSALGIAVWSIESIQKPASARLAAVGRFGWQPPATAPQGRSTRSCHQERADVAADVLDDQQRPALDQDPLDLGERALDLGDGAEDERRRRRCRSSRHRRAGPRPRPRRPRSRSGRRPVLVQALAHPARHVRDRAR